VRRHRNISVPNSGESTGFQNALHIL